MPVDMGRLNVNTATTRETFASDLDSSAAIRAGSRVTAITFKAPATNAGDVYVGMATVSSTYGWTLEPGDTLALKDISEKFSNFNGDAATSGDDIEWAASFQTGRSS